MKFRFIQQERRWYGVDTLCRAMDVSRGGYWSWVQRKPGPRQLADVVLLADIRRIHKDKRRVYGSPRVYDHLQKKGVRCGRKRIERLMRENGIRAKQGKKYKPTTTDSEHNLPVAANILNRQFQRERPNEAWVTDISVPQISGVRDGGRSPGIALQEEISNHRKRLGSKALVVSVTEKVQEMHQVRTKKMNTSEPPFTCRKYQDGIKTRVVMLPEDELGECLLIGQAVPGIEAASAWFGLSR